MRILKSLLEYQLKLFRIEFFREEVMLVRKIDSHLRSLNLILNKLIHPESVKKSKSCSATQLNLRATKTKFSKHSYKSKDLKTMEVLSSKKKKVENNNKNYRVELLMIGTLICLVCLCRRKIIVGSQMKMTLDLKGERLRLL